MKYIIIGLVLMKVLLKELCSSCSCNDQRDIVVRVEQGQLRGEILDSVVGGCYSSFKGVPYAKPPVGSLRFVDAKPPERWDGVRDALQEGNRCTQLDEETMEYLGEEDCLYLNIYTPCKGQSAGKLLPVMFFLHGGGFVFGGGISSIYGPDYLIADGVVLVTINYRLGPFGFLYMKHAAPGNAGMKDQVAALRWIQKNINAFGGDPNKVTIFGESAGGSSVNLHMISPMSKGLFHRALAQSGAATNPWAFQRNPVEKTLRLGKAVGCDQEDPEPLVECLREANYMDIIKASHEVVPTHADEERYMNYIFVPCLEDTVPGVEKFLLGDPVEIVAKGVFHDVPYMAGINSQEGLLIWGFNLDIDFFNQTVLSDLDSKWDENVWPELRLDPNNRQRSAALEDIKKFYMDGEPLTRETLQEYFDLFTDLGFFEGVDYTLRYMLKRQRSPIYLYSFGVDDELNFLKFTFNLTWPGACHADELGYLFNTERLPKVSEDSNSGIARRRLVRFWTNFAKVGDPTPSKDKLIGLRWKRQTRQNRYYLNITSELKLQKNLYEKRRNYWINFYNKYN